jgi:hypothetical protein
VELPVVTAAFSEDLKFRAAAALDLAQDLASGGLDEERIRDGIAWADFWRRFGGDPELIRCADESQSLRKEISDTRDPNWGRIREADRKYSERIDQLRRGFKPQISLDYVDEAEVAGDQIARAGSLAEVLEEYAVVDRRMTALEDCLWEVADDRERQLDLQMQEWKETHRHEQLGRPALSRRMSRPVPKDLSHR